MKGDLLTKLKEALLSVLPITLIVLLLHFTIAPLSSGMLCMLVVCAALLVVGMGLFTLGADMAMMPMGEMVGARLTQSRSLPLMIALGFVMGVFITVAEPDLQVLANQVPAVPDQTLIWTVAAGVGLFLVGALLRIVFQLELRYILLGAYALVFALAILTDSAFVPMAFDSGGVTTGPITVPFILALGVGVAAVRGGRGAGEDSFGLVALCSVGPILAVLGLGQVFDSSSSAYAAEEIARAGSPAEVPGLLIASMGGYFREVAVALSPIVAFFALFQIIWLRLPLKRLLKTGVGLVYAYVGLALFLTAANVGFMPVGDVMGAAIAALDYNWILVPLGMVIGFCIIYAEPAVHVLNEQVESITDGAISRRAMLFSLAAGVSISLALAMVRVLTGVSIWYFIVPGYALALGLSFFVPKVFTAIAFDSGGVASGPMTATFLLPFAMGACESLGGNILTDAFGVVAMVAMTPLITIQILAFVYSMGKARVKAPEAEEAPDDEIIDMDGDEDGAPEQDARP